MKEMILDAEQRFTESKAYLHKLMELDPEFLDLCKDHDLCTEAVGYWEQEDTPEAAGRVKEYRELVEELAAEMNTRLTAFRNSRGDGG